VRAIVFTPFLNQCFLCKGDESFTTCNACTAAWSSILKQLCKLTAIQ